MGTALALFANVAMGAGASPLDRFFRDVHSYSAQFTQTVYGRDHTRLDTAHGRMWIERPDKFRWDYGRPHRQVIVGDGHSVWVYDPDLRQVTVRPMAQALGDTPAAILAGKERLSDHFIVRNLGTHRGITWIDLHPRRAGGFTDIRLGFRGTLLNRLMLKDGFGQTTDMTFTHFRENRPIASQRFRFTPPKGADVVGE